MLFFQIVVMIIVPDVLKINVRDTETARPGSVYLIVSAMVVVYVIRAKVRIVRVGRDVPTFRSPFCHLSPTLWFGTLMFISGHSLWLKFVKNVIFSLKSEGQCYSSSR